MKFRVIDTRNKQYELISAAEIDKILALVFDRPLKSLDFEKVNRRRWVRSTKPDIREIFSILPMKGAWYSPAWGFSLDYVPHISGQKIRWHRTNKSALFDFRYDPLDYESPEEFGFKSWRIDSFYGKSTAIKQAKRVSKISINAAKILWNSVQSLSDMTMVFEEQLRLTQERKVNRFGFYNYVQHPMAYAFTLAKIGETDSALELLEKGTREGLPTYKFADDLRQRLFILAENN